MLTSHALRLSRGQRNLIYLIGAGAWLSGVLWLVLHNFCARPGEFGLAPHPLEPWSLRTHAAFAFAAIWLFGMLSAVHVQKGWNSRRKRYSGVALVSSFAVLILSGYLLYYVGDERARPVVSTLHWLLGAVAPLAFLAHRLKRRALASAAQHQHAIRDRRRDAGFRVPR